MISLNQQQLITQLSQDRTDGWITGDLKVVPSSFLGRLFWPIASHFVWVQKIFYGLNLEKSQKSLKTIRAKILLLPANDPIVAIFNKACLRYNRSAPIRYQVKLIDLQRTVPNQENNSKPIKGQISILTYNILFPQINGKHLSPFSTSIGYSHNNQNPHYYTKLTCSEQRY